MSATLSTQTKTRLSSGTKKLQSNPRDALFAALKGQNARIPSLKPIFSDWRGVESRYISGLLAPLREKVNQRLDLLGFSASKNARLQAADFALFTALWWPDASLDKLEILAYLVIWLFTWDDEIDEPTGLFSEDFLGAQMYREHTLRFVRKCLGLVGPDGILEDDFTPQNKIVQSFDVIGFALRDAYNKTQRQMFYDEILRFMLASEEEQRSRLKGKVPTLEEYWSFRLGTSAVYIGSAGGEYAMMNDDSPWSKKQVPSHMMQSAARQTIWDETNVIISITNDLLSLKKEMKVGGIDSIVPLTFAITRDVQKAIEVSIDELHRSKHRFDAAAAIFMAQAEDEGPEVVESVAEYIEVQRSNCIGNLVWSLETARYSMGSAMKENGSQEFML